MSRVLSSPEKLTIIPPTAPLRGRVAPPGSKSITNRALLLAALARGTSRLTGALKSDDTHHMAAALRDMGVNVREPDETTFVVASSGDLKPPAKPLFLGNAGTATRFLTAAAATVRGKVVIDGDAHMRKRPIKPLVEALTRLGIDVSTPTGCPPVTVNGSGEVTASSVSVDASLSSQYVSAILMLAACGKGPIDVAITNSDLDARGYVDLTLKCMATFGAGIAATGDLAWRVQPTKYCATDYLIEPDASAATYLWAASALTHGAIDIGLAAKDFSQPDAMAHELIARTPDLPAVIDGSQMQDAVPTLAVVAAFNKSAVRFVGIDNLRVKECDRIDALFTELNRIKPGLAEVEGNELIVNGQPDLAGQTLPTSIETYNDHRIAMSFALAGLKIGGITILNPDCVAKTYPGYWDAFRSLGISLKA